VYLREPRRTNKDGSVVAYLQLAHNERHSVTGLPDDLGSWMLNRLLWVTDSGFNSATNRACLQCGRIHCIVCEKLRSARVDATAALSRPGRYHVVGGNVSVKEVRVGDGARAERFCVCVNRSY